MTLPSVALPASAVECGGVLVPIRSLSRSDVMALATRFKGDSDAAEVFVIARGTSSTEDEVRAWRDATPTADAGVLVDAILALSGMVGEGRADPNS